MPSGLFVQLVAFQSSLQFFQVQRYLGAIMSKFFVCLIIVFVSSSTQQVCWDVWCQEAEKGHPVPMGELISTLFNAGRRKFLRLL